MKHSRMVESIIAAATARGILVHYCRNSRSCSGSPGLPDLILCGTYGTCFVEVKAGHDNPTPAQTTWHHTLTAAGQQVYILRESTQECLDTAIEAILDRIDGRPVA